MTDRSRSGSTVRSAPAAERLGRGRSGLIRGLGQRAAAARADEGAGGDALLLDDERLQVWLVAAMGTDAVHPGRLRVAPAHRRLAADRAGAGHAWSSECGGQQGRTAERPERKR